MFDYLIAKLALSLLIGLVVGLERGWRQREAPEGSRAAGIRTFGLSGLLGGILAAVSQELQSTAILVAGFLAFAGVFAWFQRREQERSGMFSVTGVVAAMAVFGVGALAVAGDQRVAAATGVALAGLLASRETLHKTLKRISWVELRSALLLAAMTAIILPLLPHRTIDPWGGVNPFEIWFFTVLTASISYGGYIAVRILGPSKGLVLSSLTGALVSSTAVTAAFARRAAAGGPVRSLSGGASLAAMVSALRVLALVALVKPIVALHFAGPAVTAAAIFGLAGAVLIGRSAQKTGPEPKIGNPFDLGPLLLFAGSFAAVALLSAFLMRNAGASSIMLAASLSGLADVDVAALSAVRMSDSIGIVKASEAVLLAMAFNAGARLAISLTIGPFRYAIPLLIVSAAAIAGGAAIHFLTVE
jgi:uncharacterized membrane protein (DUF4010 family)